MLHKTILKPYIFLISGSLLFIFYSCKNTDKVDVISDLTKDILTLSDDSLQGREPLSIGETRTVNYLEKRMAEIGLEPAFNGSYRQQVPFVRLISRVPDVIKITTPGSAVTLKSVDDYTAWCPVLDEKITITKAELVFAGYGINAPEAGWNSFQGVDLKGKILVVLVNDPDYYTGDSTYFKGKTMTYYGRWRYKFEEAERQGALGCLVIHEDGAAGYPWSIVSIKTNTPDFYLDDNELANRKCKLNGWISQEAAVKLFKASGLNFFVLRAKASSSEFKPVLLKSYLNIEIKNSWSKSFSSNVAGFIKGSVYPEEVVVYTAHWDHLGIGQPLNGDSIYNGASDNAAAIAWMFSIAKAFKNQPETPERSVLFLSPTGEESGLLGSDFFVKNSPFKLSNIVACINNDVILFLGRFRDVTVTGLGHSDLDELIKQVATKYNRYVTADPNPENGMFFRSDQLPFLKAGVPSIFAKGYSDQLELGKEKTQERINEYWKTIYHKPADEFKPDRDKLDGLADDVNLFYDLGFILANERIFPKWYKGSEFYTER